MRTRLTTLRLVTGLAAIGMLASATLAAAQKAKPTIVVNLEIHSTQGGVGNTVLPDGSPVYRDYRLSTDPDTCVQGESYSQGLASVVMNRQWDNSGTRCGAAANPTRTFRLRLEHQGACNLLAQASDQPFDQEFTQESGACVVSVLSADRGQPHVRAETLFKSKVTSTDITLFFALRHGDEITHFRLTSDTSAAVTPPTGGSKSVSYNGTSTLARHDGNPGGYVPYEFNIPMRLGMRFDRVTAP